MNKFIVVIVQAIISMNCFAQDAFEYKAKLEEVKQDGFYKIMISPALTGKSHPYFHDIRILDANNIQSACIIKIDSAQFVESSFEEFPFVSKSKGKDKQTHFIFENKTGLPINDLLLVTANLEAPRSINLSGSNNLKDWYAIKENIDLEMFFKEKKKEQIQSISLPIVAYKYFQVTVSGMNVLPVNIIRAGIYKENYTQGKYIEVPSPRIMKQKTTGKETSFELHFAEPFMVDKIDLEIQGPKFYNRQLFMNTCGHLTTFPYMATINSDDASLLFQHNKDKELCFTIENQDNAPLTIKSAKAYQLNCYLLAYLEKGKQYHLAFGDSLAKAPEYDLKFFKDSIGTDIPVLSVGVIETNNPAKPIVESKKNNNQFFLWITIGTISILLLIFTLKMAREIKKRNTDAHL